MVDSKTYALTLSGGGAKGSYIVGVLRYLWENYRSVLLQCRSVLGSSTGALIAAKFSLSVIENNSRHLDELEYIYRTVEQQDIIKPIANFGNDGPLSRLRRLARQKSLYDSSPLVSLVDQYLLQRDWEILIEAGKDSAFEAGFTIFNSKTYKGHLVTNLDHDDWRILRKAVLASSAVPVLMPSVQVFENEENYIDGCFSAFNPVDILDKSRHAETISDVIVINTEKSSTNSSTLMNDILYLIAREGGLRNREVFSRALRSMKFALRNTRLLPAYVWGILDGKAVLDLEQTSKRFYNLHKFEPKRNLPLPAFKFSQPAMSRMVDLGMKETAVSLRLNKALLNS